VPSGEPTASTTNDDDDDKDDLKARNNTAVDVVYGKIQMTTQKQFTLLTKTKPRSDMLRPEPFRKSVAGATPIPIRTTSYPSLFHTITVSIFTQQLYQLQVHPRLIH